MRTTTFLALIFVFSSCGKNELTTSEVLSSSIMSGTTIDSNDALGKITVGVTDAENTKSLSQNLTHSPWPIEINPYA